MKTQLLLTAILILALYPGCKKDTQTVITSAQSDASVAEATLREHTVFIGARDNKFYAIDAKSKTEKWTFTTGAEIYASTPCLLDSIVYIGSTDKKVYALNKNTGAKIWDYNVGWSIFTSPSVSNGILYAIGTESKGGSLVALNAYTGDLIWKTDTLLHGAFYGSSSPTVVNGILYTGTGESNSVCALNAATGKLLWQFFEACAFYSSPCIAHNMVYILGANHTLYALNARTGKPVWHFQFAQGLNSLVSTSPTVAGQTVYFVVDPESYLYALDVCTGTVKWKFDPQRSNGIYFSPLAKYGTVITCASNRIYALDSADGSVKWKKTLGEDLITCSPTFAGGIVYVTTSANLLFELDANDGNILGRYSFPIPDATPVISSPAIENKNGKIFYPSISGMEQ